VIQKTWLLSIVLAAGTIGGCTQLSGPPARHTLSAPTSADKIAQTAHAVGLLREMADFLARQERMSTTAEIGFSAVQEDGQKIEFGGSRQLLIRRPDRGRFEIRARDGVTRLVYFDRGKLRAVIPNQNIYAVADVPATIDEAIDYIVHQLEIPMPLAELVHLGFMSQAVDRVVSGFVVGEEVIDGVRSEHLAFRSENVDVQIWIAHGAAPLPRRMVISYREEPGVPEFWAHFERWDLAPNVPDEIFIFTPPPNASQVSFDELLDRVPLPPGGEDD
jgi:hypothetical protein